MEEINLLPNPRRSLAIFRGHPLATCCVNCGEDSEDLAKVATVNNIRRSVNTNLQYGQSKLATTDSKTIPKVELGSDGIPALQLEVDHDHSDSTYSEEDLPMISPTNDHPGKVLTARSTQRAYDLSSVLMQLAQLLLSMAFMESWLGGGKTRTTKIKTQSVPSASSKDDNNDNDMEPIPQIPL